MFKEVLSEKAQDLIDKIAGQVSSFYLAGGTGLALQLGHRVSEDLDLFSEKSFDAKEIEAVIAPEKVISVRPQTLHCVKDGIRLSFLFYDVPLCYPVQIWRGLHVAAWQDIVAGKIKTVSQRGSKKDFWDVYSVITLRSSIDEVGALFLERFKGTGINLYYVLKSMVYFEDADKEPDPVLLANGKKSDWERIKQFFEANIKEFEKVLMT